MYFLLSSRYCITTLNFFLMHVTYKAVSGSISGKNFPASPFYHTLYLCPNISIYPAHFFLLFSNESFQVVLNQRTEIFYFKGSVITFVLDYIYLCSVCPNPLFCLLVCFLNTKSTLQYYFPLMNHTKGYINISSQI